MSGALSLRLMNHFGSHDYISIQFKTIPSTPRGNEDWSLELYNKEHDPDHETRYHDSTHDPCLIFSFHGHEAVYICCLWILRYCGHRRLFSFFLWSIYGQDCCRHAFVLVLFFFGIVRYDAIPTYSTGKGDMRLSVSCGTMLIRHGDGYGTIRRTNTVLESNKYCVIMTYKL